ncbi:hypothetical protein BSKO_00217 [Bryopsis sp. KO-2023]|nr:hypothetical protein BSKO_00217 [Bryopsis sp. KO-2023]
MAAPREEPPPTKDHKSALCLIPPRTAWDDVQEIRCFKDKGYCRWPPHVNLLYPFLPDSDDNLENAARKASEALANFSRFTVELKKICYFLHSPQSATVWVEPTSPVLSDLQAALVKVFPDCNDLNHDPSRGIMGFVPHLGLGQWPGKREAEQAVSRMSATWKPISFAAWEVAIISRASFDDPFVIRYSIGIGTSKFEKLTVPYVPTVAAGPPYTQESDVLRFGIGAQTQGVWNFAYGANVNQDKLERQRGIIPYESVPAVLRGFRLAFNHRGAMGNVVPLSDDVPPNGYPGDVHGILHRIKTKDFIKLANMEHAYRPVEMVAEPYDGRGPIRAAVFITPEDRHIVDGLAPPDRYVNLIATGARAWGLDDSYVSWLEGLKTVPPKGRIDSYWQKANGERLFDLPVIRTGAEAHRRGGRGGRGRGRGQGRGRGGRGGGRSDWGSRNPSPYSHRGAHN